MRLATTLARDSKRAWRLLDAEDRRRPARVDHSRYCADPVGYCRDVLRVTLTPSQQDVARALLDPPRRILVSSGHSVGKSLLAACLVCWFFDTRSPGICLTTAPTVRQVELILWKEIRMLRHRAGLPNQHWVGPRGPRLELAPDHYAVGFTARDAARFQGHHSPGGIMIVFDEAEALAPDFFTTAKTMHDDQSFFVAIYNPTGGSGTATHEAELQADSHGLYRRFTLSCIDHPNVLAGERGEPIPVPGAITRDQLETMLLEDSLVLSTADAEESGDVVLGDVRYRPGPIAGARCLGRRPLTSTAGLWGEQLWARVLATRFEVKPEWPVAIGCDVARYGDNLTAIVVRKGYCLLHAETHSRTGTHTTSARLKELCHIYSDASNPERGIPVMVDEGSVGSGVLDYSDGYRFVPINASRKPRNPARYVNVRAELWFNGREAALKDCLDVSRLPLAILGRLKQELFATQYEVVPGRDMMRVSAKEDTVAILRRSPDLADAMNLACYPPPTRC